MFNIKKSVLMMLLLATVLIAGCKKENDTSASGNQNPNPAQDTPLSEHFLSEFEGIYQIYPNPDGSFYALAAGEYTDYLLKLDYNGYVQQRVELGFHSRRCIAKIDENIFLVGEMSQQGYVAVYNRDMQLIGIAYLNEPHYRISLNSIIRDDSDPTILYAGGRAVDNTNQQYPYLCTLQFSGSSLTKVLGVVYPEYAKYRIVGMVEKQYNGQKDLIIEAIHYTVLESPYNTNSSAVHIVKLNYFEENSGWGSETWDVAITGPHGDSYSGNNSIDSDENNIYFFGQCCDDKTSTPSSGGYWTSGCVAAVNWHDGHVVWTKTLSLSNKDDVFNDGVISNGCLFACGIHSGVSYSSTKKSFSNGLIVKYTLSGELVNYKTFGASDRNSGFYNTINDSDRNWVCVGYSGENLGDDECRYSAWFLKTDMSNSQKNTSNAYQGLNDVSESDSEAGTSIDNMFKRMAGGGI